MLLNDDIVTVYDYTATSSGGSISSIWDYDTETYTDTSEKLLSVDFDLQFSTDYFAWAFMVYQSTHTPYYFVYDNFGTVIEKATITWDIDNPSGSDYDNIFGRINIDTYDYNDPDTIYHEYGHLVMDTIYGSMPNTNPNNLDPSPCAIHSPNIGEEAGCAWAEGWAEFFTIWVADSATFAYGYDFEDRTTIFGSWESGENVEGNIAGMLWDIVDGTGEQDANDEFKVDDINSLDDTLWIAFNSGLQNNVAEFITDWESVSDIELNKVMYLNTITSTYTGSDTGSGSGGGSGTQLDSFTEKFEDGNFNSWNYDSTLGRDWELTDNPQADWSSLDSYVATAENCDSYCDLIMLDTVNLAQFDNGLLRFNYYVNENVDNDEGLYVSGSSDGGSTWTLIESYTEDNGGNTQSWESAYLSLSNFMNSADFKLKFTAKSSNSSEDIEIDNIFILASSSSSGGGSSNSDLDEDGIDDSVDVEVTSYSNSFTDGVTSGEITDRGAQTFDIDVSGTGIGLLPQNHQQVIKYPMLMYVMITLNSQWKTVMMWLLNVVVVSS
ncbi:MAG: hypothetical protein IS860_00595 [Nitrosopumilus sp.]|nr:hypothetical protein [Nitrosopumilus sp.]